MDVQTGVFTKETVVTSQSLGITDSLSATSDPNRFVCRAYRCSEGAVVTALHIALTHLEHQRDYARLLFIDFSSAFNKSSQEHGSLHLSSSIYDWVRERRSQRKPSLVAVWFQC